MAPAEFNTAMIHFYRGEVQRSNTWRNRLDTTTNWAVLTAGATLSFVFSSHDNPHFVIPINSILVAIFLLMEARRYRYYEIWSSRVRGIGQATSRRCWRLTVCRQTRHGPWLPIATPRFTITEWEAVGRRLRPNYLDFAAGTSWNLWSICIPTRLLTSAPYQIEPKVGLVPGWAVFASQVC